MSVNPPAPKHFVVAIDGSESAHNAVLGTLQIRSAKDYMTLLHVWCNDSRIAETRKTMLESRYNLLLAQERLPAGICKVTTTEKRGGKSTSTSKALATEIKKLKADYVVMGGTGRKGSRDPDNLGSTAYALLRGCPATKIIIKSCRPLAHHKPGEPMPKMSFASAVDGNDTARAAFEATAALVKQEKDEMYAFHVYNSRNDNGDHDESSRHHRRSISRSYTKDLKNVFQSDEVKCETVMTMTLRQYVETIPQERDLDFISVGLDGMKEHLMGKKRLGSITDMIVRSASCHVIVAAPPTRINMNGATRRRSIVLQHGVARESFSMISGQDSIMDLAKLSVDPEMNRSSPKSSICSPFSRRSSLGSPASMNMARLSINSNDSN